MGNQVSAENYIQSILSALSDIQNHANVARFVNDLAEIDSRVWELKYEMEEEIS